MGGWSRPFLPRRRLYGRPGPWDQSRQEGGRCSNRLLAGAFNWKWKIPPKFQLLPLHRARVSGCPDRARRKGPSHTDVSWEGTLSSPLCLPPSSERVLGCKGPCGLRGKWLKVAGTLGIKRELTSGA